MADRDAFRRARRSGGMDHIGELIGPARDRPGGRLGRNTAVSAQQRRQIGRQAVPQVTLGENCGRADLGEDRREPGARHLVIQGQVGGSGPPDAEDAGRQVRAAAYQDRDNPLGPRAVGRQPPGDQLRPLIDLAEGENPPAIQHSRRLGYASGDHREAAIAYFLVHQDPGSPGIGSRQKVLEPGWRQVVTRLTMRAASDVLIRMESRTVTVVELSYRIHGAGNPVLFLPPAGTRSDVWLAHQVPAVVGAGYQAIVADNRGTWPSPAPPGPYRLADMAADTGGLDKQTRPGAVRRRRSITWRHARPGACGAESGNGARGRSSRHPPTCRCIQADAGQGHSGQDACRSAAHRS